MLPGEPTRKVYPSGFALATYSVPMLPDAPVLFSTRNDLPVWVVSRWATRRVTTSTAEAAANGLTRVTGFEGQSCALAGKQRNNPRKANIFMRKGYLNVPWGQVH